LAAGGVTEGHEREMVGVARTAFGLGEKVLVLGQHKVRMFIVDIIISRFKFFHRYS
jgi:chitin synthase